MPKRKTATLQKKSQKIVTKITRCYVAIYTKFFPNTKKVLLIVEKYVTMYNRIMMHNCVMS